MNKRTQFLNINTYFRNRRTHLRLYEAMSAKRSHKFTSEWLNIEGWQDWLVKSDKTGDDLVQYAGL